MRNGIQESGFRIQVGIASLLLLCALFISSVAYAVEPVQNPPGPINRPEVGSSTSSSNCRDQHEGVLLAVIVPCIRDVIQEAAETMTAQFDDYLLPGATAFITLVLVIFGIKGMVQEGDVKKDGFILLIKIGCVFAFMEAFGGFIPAVFGTMRDGGEIVTASLGSSLQGVQCDMSKFTGEAPWNYLDCVLGTLFGFAPNMFLGSSIFGAMGSMWSSQFGASLFMGGMFIFFFILKLVFRAAYTYLMACVIVGFLIVISPVLIPLLMLGVTFQYFEHWMRALISTMIQPIIVLAYVTLCFSILDQIMFDDRYGIARQMSPENIMDWQNEKNTKDGSTSASRPEYYTQAGASAQWMQADGIYNQAAPLLTGAYGIGSEFDEQYSMDFRTDRAQKSQDLFFSIVTFAIMVWLLDQMLDSILRIAQIMLGGGFALGQAVDGNPIEAKMQEMQGGMKQSFAGGMQSFGNAIKGLAGGKKT